VTPLHLLLLVSCPLLRLLSWLLQLPAVLSWLLLLLSWLLQLLLVVLLLLCGLQEVWGSAGVAAQALSQQPSCGQR
jgi:hypothetical protein